MNGQWLYSTEHRQPCLVIERQEVWGRSTCRVWLPSTDSVARIDAGLLRPLSDADGWSKERLCYLAAAGRIAAALSEDVLLAPIEAPVIPLPHQIKALSQAVSGDRVRYLLADEVGLGKTIEAGLIIRELKLRGLVQRVLVVAPKGLTAQWASEMQIHFGETFRVILPDDLQTLGRMSSDRFVSEMPAAAPLVSGLASRGNGSFNIWTMFPQVIVPMDSVKPIEKRRGWSKADLAEHNRQRFDDLISAGWDLVIVDESHRLGGSSDQVARFKLGRGLAEASPYLLLLTATPHQGKTDAFRRIISLLDADAFPDDESVTRDRIAPYVIRTEKRRAIDADGKPLFKPRRTTTLPVAWDESHRNQARLYDAVTLYVREGYNQAMREKRNYIGFLMILMQRLVTSSTQAILAALENRLIALQEPDAQLTLFDADAEEWTDMDGQDQLDVLIRTRFKALKNEQEEVRVLLNAAKQVVRDGPDAKTEALLSLLYRLQQEEGDPDIKMLLFTEFVPTQRMLAAFFEERGISAVQINGSMDIEDRLKAQRRFAGDARILISTDAGGEGLNLQFCHVVVNYDMPWNPMRLEQRIGRVDRIGQPHVVRAINFAYENTVEYRVREVLEAKLAVILEEFGIDKTGDVLDSAQAGQIFDDLYVDAILNPEGIEEKIESAVERVREHAVASKQVGSLLGDSAELNPRFARELADHPMPHWVEHMTVNYLQSHGGQASRKGSAWSLTWPDGCGIKPAVFSAKDAAAVPAAVHLTLESPVVRNMLSLLPHFVVQQPAPKLRVPNLPAGVRGVWALWKIEIHTEGWSRRRMLPVFRQTDGRILAPTARHVWDQIMEGNFQVLVGADSCVGENLHQALWTAAAESGRPVFEDCVRKHREKLEREESRSQGSFEARRRMVGRIGLPEVRAHRLEQLEREAAEWRAGFNRRQELAPELVPLVIAYVEGES
jgi:superfamily II DNA or RNA helicase